MGKYDKDRFQKELAIRYCLARGMVPFLEVITSSVSDLSDTVEVLTDLDVVGVKAVGDGAQHYVFFDCKTSAKMSAINRAFWAAGVKTYTGYDQAYVILKSRPVTNHRLSALVIDVDLHDETSFRELGRTSDEAFPADSHYQSSIERWEALYTAYEKNEWAKNTFELVRNHVPLSTAPWTTFRRIVAELRDTRGQYDPGKTEHLAIFLDMLASVMVLWGSLGRDIRRFYEPSMDRRSFEKVLRYYIWGGRDAYLIRQQLRQRAKPSPNEVADLPAWSTLVDYAGLTVSAPKHVLACAHIFKEFALRSVTGEVSAFDKDLSQRFADDNRLRQFTLGMSGYLVEAGALPKDMGKAVDALLLRL